MASYDELLIEEGGNRANRIHNIATVITTAYKASDGGPQRFITKDVLLEAIRKVIAKPEGMDAIGDSRAHGDACGGHGLGLEMEGRGGSGKIFLNDNNFKKCDKYLSDFNEIVGGFTLDQLSKI